MSHLTGDSQSTQDDEDRVGELLCYKIKAHLEDLFSDGYLAEHGFLLKHIQRNKQGYVSLKLLTCLKKIKALTTNWHMTLAGAEYSNLLEVNDEGTKVRRIKPLPKWLLCSPTSKLLLAWNLAEMQTGEDRAAPGLEHLSLSHRIFQKFSAHGAVASFWILHPGKELPRELQCYVKHHKELGQRLCAVVKFDSLEAARKAYSALKGEEEKSKSKGMCVVPLGFHSLPHISKDEPSEERNEDHLGDTPSQESLFETSDDSVQEELLSPVRFSDKTPDTSLPNNTLNNLSQNHLEEQILTSCTTQDLSGLSQRYNRVKWCSGDCDKTTSQSPWVLRRKSAGSALNHRSAGLSKVPHMVQQVLRQPFGPDGTRGFHNTRRLLQRGEIKLSTGWRRTT